MANEPSGPARRPEPKALTRDAPTASVPGAEILAAYAKVSPDLPAHVLEEWSLRHRRAFLYAITALVIGGILGVALIGGFVYLVLTGHGGYAAALLGAGAISMVAGFRAARL